MSYTHLADGKEQRRTIVTSWTADHMVPFVLKVNRIDRNQIQGKKKSCSKCLLGKPPYAQSPLMWKSIRHRERKKIQIITILPGDVNGNHECRETARQRGQSETLGWTQFYRQNSATTTW
jgi:hypothetical protein